MSILIFIYNLFLYKEKNYKILVYIQIEHQYRDWHVSQSIVIDNGSAMIKAGFAGEDS